jgi:hypothetical protein
MRSIVAPRPVALMPIAIPPVALLIAFLLVASPAGAQPKEPLVVQVKSAIDNGVKFLRSQQRADGSWEVDLGQDVVRHGQTTFAVLALLNCGFPVTDKTVNNGLGAVRRIQSEQTYIRALQAMVLAEANLPEDRARLEEHVSWLIKHRIVKNGKLHGWSYSDTLALVADGSNTQYAVLGLWAAKQAGVQNIPPEIWEEIRKHYLEGEYRGGGWEYIKGGGGPAEGALITMTTAGVCGLLIASMELNDGRESFNALAGPADKCGVYPDSEAIERGFKWINNRFTLELKGRTYYHLYGLERAGRLSGQRYIGQYDWYREGCKMLVPIQKENGSWSNSSLYDRWPVVSTSMALLFLSKGRTPVLISKVVHGIWPRDGDTDWNNDRNDLRHIVGHASKELFKRQPLAWQTVDIMKAAQPPRGQNSLTEDDLQSLTSDLLQSPILYISGHLSPERRFTAVEKDLLKRYVDNGGFILAEACCGNPAFDDGFKKLVKDIWPDFELTPLGPEHPVWQSPTIAAPGQPYQLYGLNQGCKTVLIYSPQDLSCRWETNKPEDPRCIQAFRVGLNIIAYATGMQAPQPRLFQPTVASTKVDPPNIPRGTYKVAQLKHGGDWRPAPKAMRNLMEHVNGYAGIDVALKTEARPFHDRELIDFKFLYMHGRNSFGFDPEDLEPLRFNLKNGALLFADACCGSEAFDKSFRKFAEALLPGTKLERIPLNDVLFSKDLGGEALNERTILYRTKSGQPYVNGPPFLEGIKHDGRWVVLYSKYDIGCALETRPSTDCRGYDSASAQRIARAAVLYTLRLD